MLVDSSLSQCPSACLRVQWAITDTVGCIRFRAEPLSAVGFVFLVIAPEPNDLTVALERDDVCGDPIEKPAVVRDD